MSFISERVSAIQFAVHIYHKAVCSVLKKKISFGLLTELLIIVTYNNSFNSQRI